MKPNDTFSYLKNNQLSPDLGSLTQLYLPIMGADAYQLYQYLVYFWDNGRAVHRFTDVLNQLQFGFDRLLSALDCLGALGLIRFYQADQGYLITLHSPLDREAFLANPVYRSLLIKRIGEPAVAELTMTLPAGLVDQTKQFSEVFTDQGEIYHHPQKAKTDFDLEHFKQLMTRDGLRFADEATDVVALARMAEQTRLSWFDLYQLAKSTAVDYQISLDRLRAKQEQSSLPSQDKDFSPSELAALKVAKSHQPETFLAILKKEKKAVVTDQERQLLRELGQQGFLDEVINLMVLHTLQRTKSANLNKVYLMKLANDFAYKEVKSAEQALRHWQTKPGQTKAAGSSQAKQTNVPAWSQQDYKNQTTEAEKEQLEREKAALLARLRKED